MNKIYADVDKISELSRNLNQSIKNIEDESSKIKLSYSSYQSEWDDIHFKPYFNDAFNENIGCINKFSEEAQSIVNKLSILINALEEYEKVKL